MLMLIKELPYDGAEEMLSQARREHGKDNVFPNLNLFVSLRGVYNRVLPQNGRFVMAYIQDSLNKKKDDLGGPHYMVLTGLRVKRQQVQNVSFIRDSLAKSSEELQPEIVATHLSKEGILTLIMVSEHYFYDKGKEVAEAMGMAVTKHSMVYYF